MRVDWPCDGRGLASRRNEACNTLRQGSNMREQSPPPFATAIARLHAAMAKVANGDICGIKALYAKTGDATSFYGWGGYEKVGTPSRGDGTGPASNSRAAR